MAAPCDTCSKLSRNIPDKLTEVIINKKKLRSTSAEWIQSFEKKMYEYTTVGQINQHLRDDISQNSLHIKERKDKIQNFLTQEKAQYTQVMNMTYDDILETNSHNMENILDDMKRKVEENHKLIDVMEPSYRQQEIGMNRLSQQITSLNINALKQRQSIQNESYGYYIQHFQQQQKHNHDIDENLDKIKHFIDDTDPNKFEESKIPDETTMNIEKLENDAKQQQEKCNAFVHELLQLLKLQDMNSAIETLAQNIQSLTDLNYQIQQARKHLEATSAFINGQVSQTFNHYIKLNTSSSLNNLLQERYQKVQDIINQTKEQIQDIEEKKFEFITAGPTNNQQIVDVLYKQLDDASCKHLKADSQELMQKLKRLEEGSSSQLELSRNQSSKLSEELQKVQQSNRVTRSTIEKFIYQIESTDCVQMLSQQDRRVFNDLANKYKA